MSLLMVASAPAAAAEDALGGAGGFGGLLIRTLLVLTAVAALAVVTLRWAATRGIGQADGTRQLAVLERHAIGGRQQLLAVRLGDRVMLVGASPGRLDRLGEVSVHAWSQDSASTEPASERSSSFASLLDGGV